MPVHGMSLLLFRAPEQSVPRPFAQAHEKRDRRRLLAASYVLPVPVHCMSLLLGAPDTATQAAAAKILPRLHCYCCYVLQTARSYIRTALLSAVLALCQRHHHRRTRLPDKTTATLRIHFGYCCGNSIAAAAPFGSQNISTLLLLQIIYHTNFK